MHNYGNYMFPSFLTLHIPFRGGTWGGLNRQLTDILGSP